MADSDQKQTTVNERETTFESLTKLYQAGYEKSVIALADDIMNEYKARLETGSKLFRYIKSWQKSGYFMSPVYTEGKQMEPKNNTILQSDADITQFKIDVTKRIIDICGISINNVEAKYVDNGYGWRFMKFDIVMSLDNNEMNTNNK
jgi:hypothetical protein